MINVLIAVAVTLLLVLIFRWVRVFIHVRRGPKWHKCPISDCGFAVRLIDKKDKEDMVEVYSIIKEHFLDVHLTVGMTPPEEIDGKSV